MLVPTVFGSSLNRVGSLGDKITSIFIGLIVAPIAGNISSVWVFTGWATQEISSQLYSGVSEPIALAPVIFDLFPIIMIGGLVSLFLTSGAGLLMLKHWAYRLTLISAGLVVVSTFFLFVGPGLVEQQRLIFPLMMAWNSFMIWYLLRPGVKAQFVKERPTRS